MFRSNRCQAAMACIDACPKGAIRWDGGSKTDWRLCDQCGDCAEVCYSGAREMVGRSISVDRLIAEIERDLPFYDQSGGGVTFTGGEPLFQGNFLKEMLLACHTKEIHTIVDTSGHAPWESFELILPWVNLFLYDLKLMDEARHIQYTGVSNRLILENLHRLSVTGATIIVRIPLIPGVNDDAGNIEQSAIFLSGLPHLGGIEIIPYHEIGVAKYHSLGMNYQLEGLRTPAGEQVEGVEKLFIRHGLPVHEHFSGRTI
jgi:pyruvate formate lyase activating enzyme